MSRPARNGLSLIEVLVIICILGILVGLLMPSTRRVRDASARTVCLNNLKQMMTALHNFEARERPAGYPSTDRSDAPSEHLLPPGCIGPGAVPEERLSWMVAFLPDVEQSALYRRFDPEKGYAGNLPAAQTRIKMFLCPSSTLETTDAVTNYVAMSGIGTDAAARPAGATGNGFMGYDRRISLASIKDGASNTIALAEMHFDVGPWARGGPSSLRGFDAADVRWFGQNRPTKSGHYGIMCVVMADGSARSVRTSIEPKKLAAAITIAGGETDDLD